jgi:hypothetical protein
LGKNLPLPNTQALPDHILAVVFLLVKSEHGQNLQPRNRHLVHHRPVNPMEEPTAENQKRKPAIKGRLLIFNPASGTGIKFPPQSYSALQLNPDHLKRFVAQIFREMIESRKVHDLSSLCLNVFRPSRPDT